MSETRDEYFEKQLSWEEHFDTLDDFIKTLNIPSNASGALGRIAAHTILRLEEQLKSRNGKV